jgi:hypothetical protein
VKGKKKARTVSGRYRKDIVAIWLPAALQVLVEALWLVVSAEELHKDWVHNNEGCEDLDNHDIRFRPSVVCFV